MKMNEIANSKKILWVDDIRNPPPSLNCDVARNYEQAIKLLDTDCYDEIYLDHDLGDFSGPEGRERSGYDVLLNIIERKMDGKCVPSIFHILTANPVGRAKFEGMIKRYLS
jgi:hypothetical protein